MSLIMFYDTSVVFQYKSIFLRSWSCGAEIDCCLISKVHYSRDRTVWERERQFLFFLSRRLQRSQNDLVSHLAAEHRPSFGLLPCPYAARPTTEATVHIWKCLIWYSVILLCRNECMHVLVLSATRHRHHCNPWSVKCDPGLLQVLLKKNTLLIKWLSTDAKRLWIGAWRYLFTLRISDCIPDRRKRYNMDVLSTLYNNTFIIIQ